MPGSPEASGVTGGAEPELRRLGVELCASLLPPGEALRRAGREPGRSGGRLPRARPPLCVRGARLTQPLFPISAPASVENLPTCRAWVGLFIRRRCRHRERRC
ncbi:pre-mRNA-processing factor 17 [Platysternon megacephalum]|uniref:Pre-mRNA-processing factor 17 n=1 Tax=Platysternon megacephalum TaxID=55544 RepID=A0A4D9F9J1_9SAUR|nr:pre-mRNA-processing factor 17 [Platysternon megacephalum]